MPISIYNSPGLEQFRRERRFDPQCIKRLRTNALKRFADDRVVLDGFPEADQIALHPLQLHSRTDSQLDGASKLLFRTSEGMLIESVILRIASGRTSLCVSSQVGCAAACEFCATGKMGVAHNLSAEEIVDQVQQASQLLNAEQRRVRNIVFMGMGEPFHNEENLYRALELLTSPEFFHHSPNRILVSTVGVTDAMIRCVRRFPEVNIALSLHSANQPIREQLIPLARRYPLPELRRTLGQLNRLQRKPVMIEYIMLSGVNDGDRDAETLIAWLTGLDVHVNLITYNTIEDAPQLVGTDRERREAFGGLLKQAGLTTTLRYSLGHDIAAACGQLVQRENRRIRAAITAESESC